MLKSLSRLSTNMQRIASGKGVLILVAVFIFMTWLNIGDIIGIEKLKEISGGVGILDEVKGYNPGKLYQMLKDMGTEGRRFYAGWFLLDSIFAVAFAAAHAALITYQLKRLQLFERWQYLNLLPVIRTVLDLVENGFILLMLYLYPGEVYAVSSTTSIITIVKWALNTIGMNISLVFFSMLAYENIERRYKFRNADKETALMP